MPLVLTNGTLLSLTPVSGQHAPVLTPWAARGITATMELINGGRDTSASLRRDVNGNLRDVSDVRFRKYRLSVSCRDGEAPCLDDAWIGAAATVDWPIELSHIVGVAPARSMVFGSERTDDGYVYYRPQMVMMVTSIRDASQEYAALHNWDLTLEEV